MRIAIDHQAFSLQEYGGVSRYFYELMKRLQEHAVVDFRVFFAANRYLEQQMHPHREFPANKNFKGKLPLLRLLNNRPSCRWLKNAEFDLFHPSYYDPYFLKCIGNSPFVLTVHDMTHELYPQEFNRFDHTPAWKKLLIPSAARIIAVSDNTRKDLVSMLHADPEKIDVVHHGAPMQQYKDIPCTDKALPEHYLLYIGARNTYKNFALLVRAFARLQNRFPGLQLVAVGGGPFRAAEKTLLEKYQLTQKVHRLSGGDAFLACAYRNAEAFVFPSKYEGFGFPVLEAFTNRCPVVAANRSSLPEVGGNAALYFNPDDAKELEVKVSELLNNSNLKKELIAKGTARVKQFTWERTARETAAVYQKALEQHPG